MLALATMILAALIPMWEGHREVVLEAGAEADLQYDGMPAPFRTCERAVTRRLYPCFLKLVLTRIAGEVVASQPCSQLRVGTLRSHIAQSWCWNGFPGRPLQESPNDQI